MYLQRLLIISIVCTAFMVIPFRANSAMFVRLNNNKSIEFVTPIPQYLKASVFVNLTRGEFEVMRGKKLGFLERMYFKSAQKKLRQELKTDNDLLINKYYDDAKGKFKIDALWFVIGAAIGPLGILFAYTSHQSKNLKISAMLGTVIFIAWFGYLTIL